jgi:thiol:disulfide interchange protein DsbD
VAPARFILGVMLTCPFSAALATLAAPLSESLAQRPFIAILTLFSAGVVWSFSPCIYPMIPITVGLLAGSAKTGSRRRAVGLTLSYVTGVAAFYALLGLLAGLTGSLFGTVASSPWARGALALALAFFGLAVLDVVPIAAPRRLTAWASRLRGGSYPGALLLGATSGIVAAPCGAPAFGVVLTWVATTGNPVLGFVYLFAFSLGMTAVLAVVGIFSGTMAVLPQAGRWIAWVRKAAGVVMLVMAGYYGHLAWESVR